MFLFAGMYVATIDERVINGWPLYFFFPHSTLQRVILTLHSFLHAPLRRLKVP